MDCCAPSVVFKPFANVKAHFSSVDRGLALTTSCIACAVVFVCSAILKKAGMDLNRKSFPHVASHQEINLESSDAERNEQCQDSAEPATQRSR